MMKGRTRLRVGHCDIPHARDGHDRCHGHHLHPVSPCLLKGLGDPWTLQFTCLGSQGLTSRPHTQGLIRGMAADTHHFPGSKLLRRPQEPSWVGQASPAAQLAMGSHWLSFLEQWRSRQHPVQL